MQCHQVDIVYRHTEGSAQQSISIALFVQRLDVRAFTSQMIKLHSNARDRLMQNSMKTGLDAPPLVCLLSINLTLSHMTRSSRPSPDIILQAIKYWRWERPGNEATIMVVIQPAPFNTPHIVQ